MNAHRGRPHGCCRDLLAWLLLAAATLAICWPLGLTNRILAGVDAFTYFDPYWAQRMAAFRGSHLPLWNPYLFLGVPFLANPQAAVLYPLHWPLSWLTSEQALVWSALLHVWLAGGFTYTLARRSFRLTRPAAWLAGLLFACGGFTLARIENINQLNALAWLPALLWLYDETVRSASAAARVRWFVLLTVTLAMQVLAGHTQTTFVNLVGLALYAAWPVLRAIKQRARGDVWAGLLPLFALIPALLLSAAQLLPTLELNDLGLRTGGLPYRQTVSFSLRPRLLAQTFLPPFGGGLAEAFGSEGYAEFAGWLGVSGLVLAAWAVYRAARGRWKLDAGSWKVAQPVILAAAGVFLALGAYNPVYYVLWRIVPGFDLFRAPARWLELFAVGVALLAGIGLDCLAAPGEQTETRRPRSRRGVIAVVVLMLAFLALLAIQQWPAWRTLAGWLVAGVLAAALLWLAQRGVWWPRAAFIALVLAELWLGSRGLPFTLATAPYAAALRNAPAALLAATADQPPAGRDRFLSLSDIRYDPGDLAELRALQADRLSPDAIERMVRAAKQTEVLAPNLSLRFGLPAADGYDGGLLPLARYVKFQSLFVPPDKLLPDGRLREQLDHIPDDRLLDLAGVRFVITDKQRDLWAGDVYYDLENPAPLAAGQSLTLDLAGYPPFSATAIGLIAEPDGLAEAGVDVGRVNVTAADGASATFPLAAGAGIVADSSTPLLLRLPQPMTPATITVNAAGPGLILRGLSLIDERTGSHTSVTVSPRGDYRRIHSGDVKVYERTSAPGHAWLVHDARLAADDAAALAALADPNLDPRQTAVIAAEDGALPDLAPLAADAGPESVRVISYAPERVELAASVSAPGLLVLADADYPGWEAWLDGSPVPIYRANLMFRAVALSPGEHTLIFYYTPASFLRGAGVSACIALVLVTALFASLLVHRT
jgi:hypothetical protein